MFGVEPAYEELERRIFFIWKTVDGVSLLLISGLVLFPEDVSEVAGAMAEEFLVEDPVGVFWSDVDVAVIPKVSKSDAKISIDQFDLHHIPGEKLMERSFSRL